MGLNGKMGRLNLKPVQLEAKLKELTETIEILGTGLRTEREIREKLEARLQKIEDVEEIKKLQRAYSYYLEHWQEEELIGLFSHSPDVTVEMNETGEYKGWEGVKKKFSFVDHYTD